MDKANDKGFSLIELIIVIAVMAVLVAMIAPNLTKYLGKSKMTADEKSLDEIKHQTIVCISEAVIDQVEVINGEDGVKRAVYILRYDLNYNKVVAAVVNDGTSQFADLLTDVFYDTTVNSRINKNYDKVMITISGQVSSGYMVDVEFTS